MSGTDDKTATLGTRPLEPPKLSPGAQLGKYTLERVLGAGGMGIVWAARDPDLERSVAIKLLLSAAASPEQRQRLLREARAMARLKHPNVLTVYEVDSDGERDYIAMELVEGTSLDKWLEAKPPHAEVWDAIVAAGRGLAAAHAAGLVHRDFKPHNVLRSRDGRVLVTDFGLARGTGEPGEPVQVRVPDGPVALADTMDAVRSDRILDSTLTQPGALIGTPAYMAPEQFTGSDPDPRTDQFAFAITAWQGLTGNRPFSGQSLDELRASAASGVANVHAKIPRGIRAVLARGLAVIPDERWPDMDAMLDALVKAEAQPRRRRALIIPAAAIVAAGVLFASQHRDHAPAPVVNKNGCDPIETAFPAWDSKRRDAFIARLDQHVNAVEVAGAFDIFRSEWLGRYKAACASPPGALTSRRINCLVGERDDIDGLARLTDTIPKTAIEGVELWGLLPALTACDGDSPTSPPLLPVERKQRDAIIAVRAQLATMRTDPEKLIADHDKLIAHAESLGWKPLATEIESATATAAQRVGDYEQARKRFLRAADQAERLSDFKVEAQARIGLLEVELDAMADPTDRKHVVELIENANDAVQRAGNDPALATTVENLTAAKLVAEGDLDKGIAMYDHAREQLIAAKAYRAAGVSALQEIEAMAKRGKEDDIFDARKLLLATEKAMVESGRQVFRSPLVTNLFLALNDFNELHHRDRPVAKILDPIQHVTGKVIDSRGKPVDQATIVAWGGELAGDDESVVTQHDSFVGAIATSGRDGTFAIDAPASGSLVAEKDTARAMPIAAIDGVTLTLQPTRTLDGTYTADKRVGLVITATYTQGLNTWVIREPSLAEPAGQFRFRNLPTAAPKFGMLGISPWHEPKHLAGLDWPSGDIVDVIVRGGEGDVEVTVLRGTAIPKTQDELARRRGEPGTAREPAGPIGLRNATTISDYKRGDRHAVIADNPPGDVVICIDGPICTKAKLAGPTSIILKRP
ncbi:MAG: protein kinase [Kofleriaceae bacterium]